MSSEDVQQSLDGTYASAAAFLTLPPEAIAMIFEDACATHENTYMRTRLQRTVQLSRVCSLFRQVALDTLSIWSELDNLMKPDVVDALIQRSRNGPLAIHLIGDITRAHARSRAEDYKWADIDEEFLRVVGAHLHRWSCLSAMAHSRSTLTVMLSLGSGVTASALKTVKVVFKAHYAYGRPKEWSAEQTLELDVFDWSTPSLETLDCTNVFPAPTNVPRSAATIFQTVWSADDHFGRQRYFSLPEGHAAYLSPLHAMTLDPAIPIHLTRGFHPTLPNLSSLSIAIASTAPTSSLCHWQTFNSLALPELSQLELNIRDRNSQLPHTLFQTFGRFPKLRQLKVRSYKSFSLAPLMDRNNLLSLESLSLESAKIRSSAGIIKPRELPPLKSIRFHRCGGPGLETAELFSLISALHGSTGSSHWNIEFEGCLDLPRDFALFAGMELGLEVEQRIRVLYHGPHSGRPWEWPSSEEDD